MPAISVNLSFTSGVFGASWKKAVVLPLLKKQGLDLIPANYRPISNLTYVSKVVEKCALLQFNDHLSNGDLLPSYQSAYRSNYSTETALMKIHCDILTAMENQKVIALVGLDLSAAFDTVDHAILLKTLSNMYGVQDDALSWFQSYLSNRSFYVSVQDASSDYKNTNFSVPQGSILGPVLYSAYASPLGGVINAFDINVMGYADDHALYKAFTPKGELERDAILNLERCLSEVHSWMNSNKLKLNPRKTEFILFGSKHQLQKCNSHSMVVSGIEVKKSTSIKYLGVYWDESLSFRQQIQAKCKTALFNLSRIRSIRKYLTIDICQTLASSLVLPHLDYSNTLYYDLPDCDIKQLQRVQNMTAKLVLGRGKFDSATDSLRSLHWLPIKSRITYRIATYVYKCLHDLAPSYLKELIIIRTGRTGLRSSSNTMGILLDIPLTKRRTFKDRSFAVAAPVTWNSLPSSLHCINNYDNFKRKLKTFLFTQAFL